MDVVYKAERLNMGFCISCHEENADNEEHLNSIEGLSDLPLLIGGINVSRVSKGGINRRDFLKVIGVAGGTAAVTGACSSVNRSNS